MDITGTFKYTKVKLVKEGFNPNQISDALYFMDDKAKDYVALSPEIFDLITTKKIKF